MKYDEMPIQLCSEYKNIIILAGVEFRDSELDWMYENGVRYIVKGRCLYKIRYSRNYQKLYSAQKIFTLEKPKTNRGRCFLLTANEVNRSYKNLFPELIES